MNIHPDNRTACEFDCITNAAIALEERNNFLKQPSIMLGLVPVLDGDTWIVLYGKDIQEGICGCGDSPEKAMGDFDIQWRKEASDATDE